jgi:hypothetical protein
MAETTESSALSGSRADPCASADDAIFGAFERELASSLPFREDAALLGALRADLPPVLYALRTGYQTSAEPCTGQVLPARLDARAPLSEGYALFNLLCRRAGLLGATPTASLALARALVGALRAQGLALSSACADDLAVIAVEGYSAGRDELRERSLRTIAGESQVWFALAPRCFCLFLAGSLLPEALERLLDDLARRLFRAEARSLLVDVSRLYEAGEDQARAVITFASTLVGLGLDVTVFEERARFQPWFAQLALSKHGVRESSVLSEALARALSVAGYDLRARGRLGELIDKVRSSAR